MDKAVLKPKVYSIFSDNVMIAVALIAVPVTLIEIFDLVPSADPVLSVIDWAIWLVFLLEFALKLYVEDTYKTYIVNHRLDSAISIIIIGSGILAIPFSFVPGPALGVLRLLRIFRVLAYGDKVYTKKTS
jgi:hypothetical protein